MKTNLLPFKIAVFVSLIFISCNTNNSSESDKKGGYTDGATTLFTKVTSETSKITFKNMIREDLEFTLTYIQALELLLAILIMMA